MLNPMPKSFIYEPPTEPWLDVLHADADISVWEDSLVEISDGGRNAPVSGVMIDDECSKHHRSTLPHQRS